MGTVPAQPMGAALVAAALAGERDAMDSLVAGLSRVIQARAARAALHRRSLLRRDLGEEVRDLTQEVFAALFADGGRVLRAWDPARGMSLENFVGLVAEREVASILRSGRRAAWREDATEDAALEAGISPAASPDAQVSSRQELAALLDLLRARLSPQGLSMFQMLCVEEQSAEEVCAATGLSADAVYAWRSRLGKLVRALHAELVSESGPSTRTPAKEIR